MRLCVNVYQVDEPPCLKFALKSFLCQFTLCTRFLAVLEALEPKQKASRVNLEQLASALSLGSGEAGGSKAMSSVSALPGGGFSFAGGALNPAPGGRETSVCCPLILSQIQFPFHSVFSVSASEVTVLRTRASFCASILASRYVAGAVVRRRFRRVETISADVVWRVPLQFNATPCCASLKRAYHRCDWHCACVFVLNQQAWTWPHARAIPCQHNVCFSVHVRSHHPAPSRHSDVSAQKAASEQLCFTCLQAPAEAEKLMQQLKDGALAQLPSERKQV